MGDVMMFGIARMPYEMAMDDELSRLQFYQNTQRLAAALEAAREDAWHPIETAPKDGTLVLLWIEWSDVPVVGEFSHERWWANSEHHEVSCGAFCYGGSVTSDKGMKPTHWMPLPAPPKEASNG